MPRARQPGPRRADRAADRSDVQTTSAGTGAEPATAQRSRALPAELRPLVEGLDAADAFELDARLVRAVALEQSQEARIGFWGPPEAARFFRAVLGTVQARLAARYRRPVSEGDALEAMLQHVLAAWGRGRPPLLCYGPGEARSRAGTR